MRKVAIVTDSTTCLRASEYPHLNLISVPLSVNFEGKTYLDGIDITPSTFYQMLEVSRGLPTSSQPSAESFRKIYKELIGKGFDVLVLTMSSKLSGTWDSALQATKGLPRGRVEVIDTLSSSLPQAMIALKAAEAADAGASLLEAKHVTEKLCKSVNVFFAVNTLEYLHRGGRIGSAAKFIGSALDLKPILTIRNGYIEAIERVRTTKKAHTRLVELIEKEVGHKARVSFLGVTHSNAVEPAQNLLNEAHKRFRIERDLLADLSPVIGVHLGPGALGIVSLTEA